MAEPVEPRGSLRLRVLALALAAVGIAWIAAASIAYVRVRHEADELLDGYLAQAAAILQVRTGGEIDEAEIEHVNALHRYARRLMFQVWDGDELRVHSANAPDVRLSPRLEGFDDVEIGGRAYRVFSSRGHDGSVLVQVAEERHVRNEIVAAVAAALATPMAVALPVLALVLGIAVSTGTRPLRTLGRQVSERDPANLEPIRIDRAPAEIAPVVAALNALFDRVRVSLEHERRFTSDAAHELRTPVAALRAQAEVARQAATDEARRHALDGVIAGCDRATRLVEQMLTLSRLDPAKGIASGARCDLALVARDAAAEAAPAAFAKDVEIALDARPCVIRGDAALLGILLRNLLDNAVRYTPSAGHVWITVRAAPDGASVIEVEDDGPGVPQEVLGRLGDRFFRIAGTDAEGSGLGLSIVMRIASLHAATVDFESGRNGAGLRARVTFRQDLRKSRAGPGHG